ncbi:glutamate--tRNA ligase [Clostridia bacterium]|nr:glutamate--tRNA ligase [Clostridia bacterium]
MTTKDLADLIFPSLPHTPEEYETLYPPRELSDGAAVTRFAPSPTGFVHIGNFLPAFIDFILAKSTGGINYLRNEDTDKKREVDSAVRLIVETLAYFGICPDEYQYDGKTAGAYGPYIQSERKEIYHAYVKRLIEIGRAYPCFCSAEDISALRASQEEDKLTPGYYGEFAKCRNLSPDEAAKRIESGEQFVIRFRSEGDPDKKFTFRDEVKGNIEFPENNQDIVILKTGVSLPTYHFAHAVDDHLMRTTHVVRGEEWLSSVPVHVELFKTLGFKPPRYVHNPLILKRDQDDPNCVRKISKRKDPEALMDYYIKKGYPSDAVVDAVMTIVNSNYEDWRNENPDAHFTSFHFSTKKMSASGAFFDLDKLNNTSKGIISRMSADRITELSYEWAKDYDSVLAELIGRDKDYYKEILRIEREQPKPRKDIETYSGITDYMWYMYDDLFTARKPEIYPWGNIADKAGISEILNLYADKYYAVDTNENWFANVKELCAALNYAQTPKEYKANPEAYKGSLSDVMMVLRVAATSLSMTFDLYGIMKLLGKDRLKRRFDIAIESVNV